MDYTLRTALAEVVDGPSPEDVDEVLWTFDDSPSWEVSFRALFRTKDGQHHYLECTGCSCWPDRGGGSVVSCSDRETAFGPFFVPSSVKELDPEFWSQHS